MNQRITLIHSRRRDMMDTRTFSILSLCLIPGISKVTAKAIVDSIGYVGNVKESDIDSISNVQLGSRKRIGKKKAERILSYFAVDDEKK